MARSVTTNYTDSNLCLTVSEAKKHLRVSTSSDDTYIESLLHAAQQEFERYCNVSVIQKTFYQYCDTWCDTTQLYNSPAANSGALNVDAITYYNLNNVITTWNATNYLVDGASAPARVSLNVDKDYPDIADRKNAIIIQYTSGFKKAGSVPQGIKQAILILVGQWYENRQEAIVGRSVGSIPMTARYIMDRYRIKDFGLSC
jgi:uncharacterized phiE125 gp8 family phage protein